MMDNSALDRFNRKWLPHPRTGCWVWTAAFSNGYGHIRIGDRMRKAHRVSYLHHVGSIPFLDSHNGMCVCHRCDNKKCVNPEHLFLGSHADNMRDRDKKGLGVPFPGELNGRSKLTNQDVIAIRADTRTLQAIADEYGMSNSHVSQIRSRKRWAHI